VAGKMHEHVFLIYPIYRYSMGLRSGLLAGQFMVATLT
jgi:hypothetical protein